MDGNRTLPKRLGGVLSTILHHFGKSKAVDSRLYPPPQTATEGVLYTD